MFGCGPMGQFAIWTAGHKGAARVITVDSIASRLEMARSRRPEAWEFEKAAVSDD